MRIKTKTMEVIVIKNKTMFEFKIYAFSGLSIVFIFFLSYYILERIGYGKIKYTLILSPILWWIIMAVFSLFQILHM